jgi:hypothetical protein
MGRAILMGLGLIAAITATKAAEPLPACPAERLLYVPIETVSEPLGLRGETRAQYLDRRYGAGKWQLDENGAVVTIASPAPGAEAPFEVRIVEPPGMALERAEVIVEARLLFRDHDGRLSEIHGHREAGSFRLESGADAALRVPRALFKEPGALLVAVSLAGGGDGGSPPVHVAVVPVGEAASSCQCCVYVPDRFTAIRLNRSRNRAVEGP